MGRRAARDGRTTLPATAVRVIEERHKPAMVESGRWRATAPHVEGHAGFRLNALVSRPAERVMGEACGGVP